MTISKRFCRLVDMIRNCILALLLFPLVAFAGGNNVTVTGRTNKADAMIRLMVYDDLLNMHEVEIAQTHADEKGFFLLEGKVDCIMPARIMVGLESVDMFVTPDASYDVVITVPDVDPSASYFERRSPSIRVKTATDHGVYRQIIVSEQIINGYVLNYFDELFRRRQSRYLDSIKATIDAEMDIKSDYVIQQNNYKIASIQMALDADGGKKVIRDYYDGKPVLYRCMAYIDLFKDLFKNYELSDEFIRRNPELSDLVNIYRLRSLYYEDYQSRGSVKIQLQSIGQKSKSAEIKKLVANTLGRFNRFAQGADAPDFELQSSDGSTVKLSDYKNTMVLLQFVDGSSQTVEHQFEVLSDLRQQWQDSVQLITVSTKDQIASHRKRFEEHRYDWPLLNLGNDILLLERYEVRTFPEYFLILPGTKIGLAPAPNPDRALRENVTKLLKK